MGWPPRWSLWLIVALLTAGCAPSEDVDSNTTTLVVWHAYRGAELDALNASLERFEATHDAVRVRGVSIPYDAFANKVSVAVPRGNGPDLFIYAHDRVGDWAQSRLIEPVDFWVQEDLLDRFFKTTIDPLVYRGQLYGLPVAFKTLALYYDTRLVKTPPTSTAALEKIAQAVRAKDPEAWGLAYPLDSLYFHAPWLHAFGGRVYSDDKDTIAIDEPAAEQSVAFIRGWVERKVMPDEITSALITALFRDGKLAFVLSGPWFKGELGDHKTWGVAPLPVVTETGRRARPFLGVEAVLLSAHSANKRLGFELMRFLTSDGEASQRLKHGSQLVANQRVYADPAVISDPFAQAFRAQVDYTVSLSNRPHMRRVWSPVQRALSKGIVHGEAPGPALKEAADAIRRTEN